MYPRGEGDARDDFDGQFQAWYEPLWSTVATALGVDARAAAERGREPLYTVEVVRRAAHEPVRRLLGARGHDGGGQPRAAHARRRPIPPIARRATSSSSCPPGVTYRAGDHLGVIAAQRGRARQARGRPLRLRADAFVRLRRDRRAARPFLPVDEPISVYRLLGDYVELQDVATRSQIQDARRAHRVPVDPAAARRPSPGTTRRAPPATRRRCWPRASRSSTCSRSIPPARCRSTSISRCCRRCAPRYYSISSSPLRDERHAAASRSASWRARPLRPRRLHGRVLELPAPPGGGRASSTPS